MSTGFTSPIVHSPRGLPGAYAYRSRMGMVEGAEFNVFHDDFNKLVTTNVPSGWTAAVIDTGATAVAVTTAALGATGAILMSDATLSEGIAIYLPKAVQLTAGKKFFMEINVRQMMLRIMLFSLVSLIYRFTNPEDLWTTVAANLVSFGILMALLLLVCF